MKKYNTKNTQKSTKKIDKGDLKAAREQLKAFRHDVALLKRKGLISKKYDARSVEPSKYLKQKIREFGAVLQGEAAPARVSKEKARYYKEQGYKVTNGRVIVPVGPGEKVYGTHGDFRVKIVGKGGSITRIDLGLSRNNIHRWRDQLLAAKIKLKPDERLTFQLFGNNSHISFRTTEQMLMYLEHYGAFEDAESSLDPDKQEQFITNVVIFKIDRDATVPRAPYAIEISEEAKRRQALKRQMWLDRMSPQQRQQYSEARAEEQKKRRDKMTDAQREEYKRKARERARKSYSERTGKK